jgi:hypothetical protein
MSWFSLGNHTQKGNVLVVHDYDKQDLGTMSCFIVATIASGGSLQRVRERIATGTGTYSCGKLSFGTGFSLYFTTLGICVYRSTPKYGTSTNAGIRQVRTGISVNPTTVILYCIDSYVQIYQ